MKPLPRLLLLLLWISSCTFFNKSKETPTETQVEVLTETVDSTTIPVEYAAADSIMSLDSALVETSPPEPVEPLEFMTIEEWAMINEINLLRGDPQAYLRFVDEYMGSFIRNPAWSSAKKQEEMAAADELRQELRGMEPLNALYPYFRLHQIAVMHGEDMKTMGSVNHIGSDGAHPYQRIRNNSELDGAENLTGGYSDIRETVISLLIDGGISSRGHRRNLLDPRWQYVACSYIGTVEEIDNVWVQLFAFEDPSEEAIIEESASETLTGTRQSNTENKETPIEKQADKKVFLAMKANFLSAEERQMVNEINLMRSNPAAYVPYVDEYAKEHREKGYGEDLQFDKAVAELKAELKAVGALSQLQPHEKLYEVARAHGLDNKQHNQLEHAGTDGSDPFERVKRSGLSNHIDEKGFFSPNENLVGGETTVRNAVLALLIDAGTSNRGHRRTLLDPNWEFVACYKIGLIENLPELRGSENDDMDHCWIQLFAKE